MIHDSISRYRKCRSYEMQMHSDALRCAQMHSDALRGLLMNVDALRCIYMHLDADSGALAHLHNKTSVGTNATNLVYAESFNIGIIANGNL